MANLLRMAIIESILSLSAQGWSQRRIARELGIDRGTVGKYLKQRLSEAKPANLPTGSDVPKPATLPMPPGPESAAPGLADSKPANLPTGSEGTVVPLRARSSSKCEAHRELILTKLKEGLTARRIHQDLGGDECGFGYDSVRRLIQRLGRARPLPFRRMECLPGEEAQVDFGTGAPVISSDGKRRRTYVFRIVFSHSRKGYSEATYTQTTEDFFRALENAFHHFGGVPKTVVIDNLKAAVSRPDWFDPELTPKVQSFCQHYGIVILPTKPYTPRHKGKIERGIGYVKNNALKGRTFETLSAQNDHLAHWEKTIADTRIHGTTKQQVKKVFDEVERPVLSALPLERFPCFQEAKRKVHRDGHVEVAKAFYSVPPEYLGREVWIRWDARLVRVFNQRWEQITLHVRHEPGKFSTQGEHVSPEKISGVERGAAYLMSKVSCIGPRSRQWAEAMLHARGIEGTRVLQGLLSLTRLHRSEALENACEIGLLHGCFRLRSIRKLLQRSDSVQQPLPFLDEHPIIRPLSDYAAVVSDALQRQADRSSMSEGFERHGRAKANSSAHEKSPAASVTHQSSADLLPPSSGYPSSGCTSAEPDSVSPDDS